MNRLFILVLIRWLLNFELHLIFQINQYAS